MSCCNFSDSEKSQQDRFCQDDHDTSGYMDWKYHEGRTGLIGNAGVLHRYFQVSPKLLGFGEACPGVLKVSCCGVASWALRNLATSVSMIWICFKIMWLESHACTGKIHAGGSACTSPPVRLDHLFFTCRFCLQCFVPLPSAVFSYVQTPNKPC